MVAGLYTFGGNVNGLLLNNYAGTDLDTWINVEDQMLRSMRHHSSFPLKMRLRHSERLEFC